MEKTVPVKMFRTKDGRDAVLRMAGEGDYGETFDTFRSVASENVYLLTEKVDPASVDAWRKRWKDNGRENLCAVASVDGRIAGTVLLNRFSNASKTDHVRMLGMWVLRNYRGIGIGEAMMAYSLDWAARKTDIRKIALGVWSSNLAAIGLYLKTGFVIEGSSRGMALINGRYVDEINMGLYMEEYRSRKEPGFRTGPL